MTNERTWTWTDLTGGFIQDAVGIPSALALDRWDQPHIAFSNAGAIPHNYRYASIDSGRWRFHTLQSDARQLGASMSVAMDSTGHAHIAYIVRYDADSGDMVYGHHNGQWLVEHVYWSGYNPHFVSIALDSRNNPHIAFYVGRPKRNLMFTRRPGGPGTSWETGFIDESPHWLGHYPSAVMDRNDRLHVAYHDNSDFVLKYAVSQGTGWRLEVVDQEGPTGYLPSLAIDSVGRPRIAYTTNSDDSEPAKLRYAAHDGNRWQLESVADANRASDCSIALDSLDRSHIVFQTFQKYELVLAYYDADNRWTLESLRGGTGYGGSPCIRIDSRDRLHVATGRRYSLWETWLWYGARRRPTYATRPAVELPITPEAGEWLRDESWAASARGDVERSGAGPAQAVIEPHPLPDDELHPTPA
jgi:hypothetical protein